MKPGSPQSTSLVFTEFTSSFLAVEISSKYLFQSWKLSFGPFLHPQIENFALLILFFDFYLETFLNAMPVSVVESPPLAEITPACLNHLSDWLSLMVFPSAALSPNLEKRANLFLSTATSATIYMNTNNLWRQNLNWEQFVISVSALLTLLER